ncbi:MAG: penicillin-binding transpeptidase domain-containing protein [Planctomycetota bacterium]
MRVAFGLLGAVPVFLAGWLGWLQVAQAGELVRDGKAPLRLVPATADRQGVRHERVPAPRGSIVDRNGMLLALDCETYEVRADVRIPNGLRSDAGACRRWLLQLIDDLSLALVADPGLADRADARARHAERLARLFQGEFRTGELPASGPVPDGQPLRAELLVAAGVDVLSVVQALRAIPECKRYATVGLHFLRAFRRAYPERELTYGLVGHVATRWQDLAGGGRALQTFGVCGLETNAALEPDGAAARTFWKDGLGRPYFVAPLADAPAPDVLHSTLDIELQRIAVRELSAQAEAGAREGKVTIPKWGALVLVEIATGDVLAAASWHRDAKHPEAASFTPYQSLFEPGSIVKPLVLAYAHEVGALDWNQVFDCAPGSADYRERIQGLGRAKAVSDDHACRELTPHGILVNSSNIGASYCGLLLAREQWQDYMRFFGFGLGLALQLPHGAVGGPHKASFDSKTPLRSFRANSAISFSFGYELQATTLHVARAYLRLFRGAGAELRLCRGVEVDGDFQPAPAARTDTPALRPEVLDAVRAAMVDVVSADPHATGTHLHARMLKESGIDLHGLVGGKTGTAASAIPIPGRGRVSVRNASFVGFLPAESPRWLAVCVLQKDDSARFYGGSYAAPPAVRLLLQCQQLDERRLLHQESPRGASGQARMAGDPPGDSGWGRGAPETTSVGR